MNLTPLFLHRPQGNDALPVAGSGARVERAVQAVLRTADGGVLVRAITRQPGGSFTGEVYGVTPREREVAVGDRVTFGESQIFTYKTADAEGPNRDEAELAEMIRAFGEGFRDAAAPNEEGIAVQGLTAEDFAPRPAAEAPKPRVEPPPAAAPPEPTPAAPMVTPIAPPPEPEISVADAYALLRGSEPATIEPREEHVEPPVTEAPAPVDPPAASEPISCMECGATVVVAHADGEPPPQKVSCPACGRINDVAQARRRR